MKKIAFINQRYGLEVNGGSEYYTRLMAEHLTSKYEVDVLTTKAIDYMTWENHYAEDVEQINGVTVRRFSVDYPRNQDFFNAINARILTEKEHSEQDEYEWTKAQGPVATDLIDYISRYVEDYDAFIFVTYLYYTTSVGMRVPGIEDKSVLIPTAHDEPYIYFQQFKKVFHKPKAIVFLTDEERIFVHKLFRNEHIPNDTFAVGIDVPKEIDAESFKRQRALDNYLIYVGRIDEGKGCDWLFKYFIEYKKRNQNDLKLVLMGKNVIDIPKHPDIISLGFVSEAEKFNGIAGAKALVLPSFFESLSISVLEAMAIRVPVIVNGRCEVLKGHCVKSNAGLYYKDYLEFEGVVNYLYEHQEIRDKMCSLAERYVRENYEWNVIVKKFEHIIELLG